MMKKITCLLLALLTILSLVACQKDGAPKDTTPAGTDAPEATVDLITNGKNQFSIVLPKDCSTTVTEASTELMNAMKEIGGKKPERYYDDTKKNPEQKNEILIGVTSREASKNVAKTVQEGEFVVEFQGSKLVIVAANDHLLLSGVQALVAAWKVSGKSASIAENLSLRQNLSAEMTTLLADGAFRYSVIYDKDLSKDTVTAVNDFAASVKNALGCGELSVNHDKAVEAKSSTYEILVGLTNRKASKAAYSSLSKIGYSIAMDGKKIVLAASNEELLRDAIHALLSEIKSIKEGTIVGAVMMKNDYSRSVFDLSGVEWFESVPALTAGTFGNAYQSDDNKICVFEREDTTVEDFNAYVTALTAAGFTGGEDYTLDQNLYALRHGEKASVYVSYSDVDKTMRLYSEKKGTSNYPEKGTATDPAKTPVLWQLEVENLVSRQNGGMSYVFLTANDTFVVIDGGYNTGAEADNLYNFLKSKTPAGKETVIEAWYISHLHGDHIGAVYAFAQKYSNKVDVQSFYYRFDYINSGTNANTVKSRLSVGKWSDAVHYDGLQTGMEFNISGIQFNVLYTMVDLYPRTAADFEFNNTSTVLRTTVKGQRVLFLGDIMKEGCDHMTDTLSVSTFRSDIVQFSHHGYEGATKKVYDSVAAGTVLWPMNIIGNQEKGYSSIPQKVFANWYHKDSGSEGFMSNKYICTQAGYVKQVIVAGMGDYEINFPYTPSAYPETGTRLPDFETYYEEKVAELQGGN
jgi:hypothetical protein